jgi:TctA family transporter
VFVTRPLSLVMLLMAVGLIILIVLPNFRKTREVAFQEDT